MPVTHAPVLVTGATGFLGAEVVRQLLAAGYRVRGTTRNVGKCVADGHLGALPGAAERLELVEADLVHEGAFDEAIQGCEYVMHTASPYILDVEDPQRDLVDPAVQGTLSVLTAAKHAPSVKRVVLTSSFAAISGEAREHVWNEEHWNDTSTLDSGPYAYSKTQAEKAAWAFMEGNDVAFDLVVINPTGIVGPSMVGHVNQTHQFFVDATRGAYPGIIDLDFPFVDVRDVALAHIRAMETPHASGRYLTSAGSVTFRRMMEIAEEDGHGAKYKLPKLSLDNRFGTALVKLAATFQPKGTRDFLRSTLGKRYALDTSKVQEELGIEFTTPHQAISDALTDLEAWGHLGK